MENNESLDRYTKGEPDSVIRRIEQVHTMTVNCPVQDEAFGCFKTFVDSHLSGYKDYHQIPTIDLFSSFLTILNFCKDHDIDTKFFCGFGVILKTFTHLKYVTLVFTDDENVYDAYKLLDNNDPDAQRESISLIYNIDVIEFRLYDMFEMEIIDMLNKVMMFDEIIPNSYLERVFNIDFTFDEYVSYIEMFVHNNINTLNSLDKNIVEYLLSFPKIINRCKPNIRLITTYQYL
jgi:hypothetical protein